MENFMNCRSSDYEDKVYAKQVVKKLLGNMENSEIHINNIDKLGWTATIRKMDYDLLFTYYSEDCWKLETFPVAMMSGSLKRSIQIF